jgi:uncharacterized protein YfcZ (UPF0381/DUF406 family)
VNDHDHDCQAKPLGTLADHSDCYRELRHIERERDDLRNEMAAMRAENLMLRLKLRNTESRLALEEKPW